MALQVLGVEIGLGAVRAGEFSVCILDRDDGVLCASSRSLSSRPSGSAGQDSTTSLRSNNVGRLLAVLEERVGLHQRTGAIRRSHTRLGHEATRRHGAQDGRTTSANRRRSNWLRVRDRGGGLRHHGSRGGIALVRVRVLGHGVNSRSRTRLRSLLVARKVIWGWRVGSAGSSRCMRVASVQRLHRNGMGLQRWERLRQRRARLKLVRRDGSRRRVCLGRGRRDAIARVLRVVHDALRKDASRARRVCCVFGYREGDRDSRFNGPEIRLVTLKLSNWRRMNRRHRRGCKSS